MVDWASGTPVPPGRARTRPTPGAQRAPRRFGSNQRVALFLAGGGKCASCGEELTAGWHGDHVVPYARGGATDVLNGQSLCATCNKKKGVNMLDSSGDMRPWPTEKGLRAWQQAAADEVFQHQGRDFLAVATPGSGKTLLALWIARCFLVSGRAERAVVVVPTHHLRGQWGDAAHAAGIELDPGWTNGVGAEARDFRGVVVTYQQVAANPDIHRAHCRRPTLVILDEIHHAGDDRAWGNALREAFEPASFRLLLSGTPFRGDSNPIPFVTYEDGRSKAHFTYDYGAALAGEVCRPVLFPSFEGRMTWLDGAEYVSATFEEALSEQDAARRLRTALDPEGEWLRTVLGDANEQVSRLRRDGDPAAGGLVIAMDQAHARAVASLLTAVSGEEPTVAISDEPDASARVKAFACGTGRWIVAVKMVSEGVDIPRLRVGVYATNVATELFFRQAVGRLVRRVPHLEEQSAYLYIPKNEALVGFAEKIKEERDHQLAEEAAYLMDPSEELAGRRAARSSSPFVPISSVALPDAVIFEGDHIGPEELAEAKRIGLVCGFTDDAHFAKLAKAVRLVNDERRATPEPSTQARREQAPPAEPTYELKRRLRRAIQKRVALLASITGKEYRSINRQLNAMDEATAESATVEQLVERLRRVSAWLDEARARTLGTA